MDKDLSLIYASISGFFSFAFGVELGVVFSALAGSFLSVRFCQTKTTRAQGIHVLLSALLTCIIVGGTVKVYPDWISLKVVALLYGFLVLLLAEKLYTTLEATNFTEKLSNLIDRVTDKWTR